MDLELSDKVALVTGSSRGLGLSIADTLHAEGCQVILNGRNREVLEEKVQKLGGRATGVVADVTVPEECRNLIRKIEKCFDRLDILVCNVGSGASVPPGQETLPEWRRVFDLNFTSTTNIIEAASELMSRHGGSIVCISSICGLESLGAPLTYSASKAALNSYVRGISRPFAERGLRINAVAPGNLLFSGSVWERKIMENADAVQSMLDREVALKRLGKPEEIADFVAFLSSARSSFATGCVYVVDGGQVRS